MLILLLYQTVSYKLIKTYVKNLYWCVDDELEQIFSVQFIKPIEGPSTILEAKIQNSSLILSYEFTSDRIAYDYNRKEIEHNTIVNIKSVKKYSIQ
jgi:hypothetical protein